MENHQVTLFPTMGLDMLGFHNLLLEIVADSMYLGQITDSGDFTGAGIFSEQRVDATTKDLKVWLFWSSRIFPSHLEYSTSDNTCLSKHSPGKLALCPTSKEEAHLEIFHRQPVRFQTYLILLCNLGSIHTPWVHY